MRDLSVLIPARNEMWLGHTVRDVLAHKTADTEIIVLLDGAWPSEPLAHHPDVSVVYVPSSIGQRAATNLGAKLSSARYLMKLDGHCAVAPGFDSTLIDAAQTLGDDCTQIPAQHNLHVFDWVCSGCHMRIYQGPTPFACACGGEWTRDVVWNAERRRTEFWKLDGDLKFGYWGEYRSRPEAQGDICDVMTSLGACFFMARERFWQLGGLDEGHGSWGQFGCEIALKSWLSGGRHVVNKRTWFSHMFRTQGGDFSFPYPITHRDQERAREYSRNLWLNNGWSGQVKPLKWLLDKFSPVPEWSAERIAALPELPNDQIHAVQERDARGVVRRTRGIVYYSDCRPDAAILDAARDTIAAAGLPIVSVTLKPVPNFGHNIVLNAERGYLTMFRQILAGLEALDTDDVFFCEHDVLYSPSHFDFVPPSRDCYYYNLNVWKVDIETGKAVTYVTKQTSGLCADRQLLIEHYRKRVERVHREGFTRRMGFEPGSHGRPERVDSVPSDVWRSQYPNLDLRHKQNLTSSRWSPEQFRDQRNCQGWREGDEIPGWGHTADVLARLLKREVAA